MSNPSYYFTLFKKFQILGHVAEGTRHGSASPPAGFSLLDPHAPLTTARNGIGTDGSTPFTVNFIGAGTADSPLYGVLSAKANGTPAFIYPTNGLYWNPMPFGSGATVAWGDFGGTPLVNTFAAWFAAGKPVDIPDFLLGALPNGGTVPGATDAGASPFVCSSATDDGTRPGSIPADFWDSSLVYLVDPASGAAVNPPTIHAAAEYYVAAVIGNRGTAAGGKYNTGPTAVVTPSVQAQGWVFAFGTGGASPAVQLPPLSNLDPTDSNGIYEVYNVPSAKYDVVGFRLNAQNAFDGLVAAINAAVTAGTYVLPSGVTPEMYLKTSPSHLCVKVGVRQGADAWPAFDSSPVVERRLAQKNLVPFDMDLADGLLPPYIHWKYFTVGSPLMAILRNMHPWDRDLGINTLVVHGQLPEQVAKVFLAVPRESFKRWFDRGAIHGFDVIQEDCRDSHQVPFGDHVVLDFKGGANAIRLPYLGEQMFAMAIGVQLNPDTVRVGMKGRVMVEHKAVVPVFGKKHRCYEVEDLTIGGFTLQFHFTDGRPKGHGHGQGHGHGHTPKLP